MSGGLLLPNFNFCFVLAGQLADEKLRCAWPPIPSRSLTSTAVSLCCPSLSHASMASCTLSNAKPWPGPQDKRPCSCECNLGRHRHQFHLVALQRHLCPGCLEQERWPGNTKQNLGTTHRNAPNKKGPTRYTSFSIFAASLPCVAKASAAWCACLATFTTSSMSALPRCARILAAHDTRNKIHKRQEKAVKRMVIVTTAAFPRKCCRRPPAQEARKTIQQHQVKGTVQ